MAAERHPVLDKTFTYSMTLLFVITVVDGYVLGTFPRYSLIAFAAALAAVAFSWWRFGPQRGRSGEGD